MWVEKNNMNETVSMAKSIVTTFRPQFTTINVRQKL